MAVQQSGDKQIRVRKGTIKLKAGTEPKGFQDAVPEPEHEPAQGKGDGRDDEQACSGDVGHPGQGHQVDQLDALHRQAHVKGKINY